MAEKEKNVADKVKKKVFFPRIMRLMTQLAGQFTVRFRGENDERATLKSAI